jgi:hypothetical protein
MTATGVDRGADASPALAGARDRAFGAGGEVDLTIAQLRSVMFFRYSHDVAVQTRPEGQLVLVGFTVRAWQPSRPWAFVMHGYWIEWIACVPRFAARRWRWCSRRLASIAGF